MKPFRYDEARELMAAIMEDFRILAGDKPGPSDESWQDVAGTCSVNLHVLSKRLEAARTGLYDRGGFSFPSPDDLEG